MASAKVSWTFFSSFFFCPFLPFFALFFALFIRLLFRRLLLFLNSHPPSTNRYFTPGWEDQKITPRRPNESPTRPYRDHRVSPYLHARDKSIGRFPGFDVLICDAKGRLPEEKEKKSACNGLLGLSLD
ncbi:hypothetical protein SODALDRAFT_113370 [Sodiomyces alkalinus F11]|uniref:Uncharacterized protein n=1 Tax=Sodiomyces alkalinus (strain CBS 110278 / VKM F-3762 / F11) TaxID=1314773 RepID=A0A3N2Q321_SODAK|nr:hypothetical protein SODALDRAFT_113370 [Sodiomyces alkalinus F11]ROT41171.1 hypothetical protein SODALDRAFT_113370 [Sodiomyces alkalinus F11]